MNKRFKNILAIATAIVSIPAFAATVTLGPGKTLDWATDKPGDKDTIEASGGTIINLSGDVKPMFKVSGPVTVTLAAGAAPRLYSKILKTSAEGKLTFSGSISIGGTSSTYAYVDDDVVAFADSTSTLTFCAYAGVSKLPETWLAADRIIYNKSSVLALYGSDMQTTGTYVAPASTTTGEVFVRMTSNTNFGENVTIRIPEKASVTYRVSTFNPSTGAGTAVTTGTTSLSNDVILAGGRFKENSQVDKVYFYGTFSGNGEIEIENLSKEHYFKQTLEGMSADSTLTLDGVEAPEKASDNFMTRVNSGFPGTVTIESLSADGIVSFGCEAKGTSKKRKSLRYGAIQTRGSVTLSSTATFRGPLYQYNSYQDVTFGSLDGILALSPSQDPVNSTSLTIDEVKDGSEIWIRYSIDLKIGKLGKDVKLHFASNLSKSSNGSNTVEVTEGAFAEIDLRGSGNTIWLKNVSADSVVGDGTIVVTGGKAAFGKIANSIQVDAQGGEVKFGSSADLSAVLGARPALWLDASDETTMLGLFNQGWYDKYSTYIAPTVMVNGQQTIAYTNSCPLIEKWFDKRPEQTLNFGWNDRYPSDKSTLCPTLYPYLIRNGLNGRSYMSFGSFGSITLAPEWSSNPSGASGSKENRRLPIMQGEDVGHAISLKTAVMVFGSQMGGGCGIIGGYDGNGRWTSDEQKKNNPDCNGNFVRGGTGSGSAADPLFAEPRNTWIDGETVDSTVTGLNGGWQIISFDGEVTTNKSFSTSFRSLGIGKKASGSNVGGQNYAEAVFFTNVLTSAERQVVEEYLAYKWGLPLATILTGNNVMVGPNATVSGTIAAPKGSGVWSVRADAKVAVPTDFIGTIGGAGEATSDHQVGVTTGFAGALSVTDTTLDFSYADGAFANAMVATGATLTFPSSVTVNLTFGEEVPAPGEYDLVSAGALTGLEEITAVTSDCSKRFYGVRKVGNRLVLTVSAKGMILIVK